jgi:hypothetical protein
MSNTAEVAMTYEELTDIIDGLVRDGRVTCVCAECDCNVTKDYLQSLGAFVKCSSCNTNLDVDNEILYVVVQPN